MSEEILNEYGNATPPPSEENSIMPTVAEATEAGINFVTGSLSQRLSEALGIMEGMRGAEPLAALLTELTHSLVLQQMLLSEHLFINDLLGLHPDALVLRADSSFREWALAQPPLVQACLIHSQNPEDAAWAISLYKEELKRAKGDESKREEAARREARLLSLASPSRAPGLTPAANRFTREDIARMSVEEFRKNEAGINAALAVGEIA